MNEIKSSSAATPNIHPYENKKFLFFPTTILHIHIHTHLRSFNLKPHWFNFPPTAVCLPFLCFIPFPSLHSLPQFLVPFLQTERQLLYQVQYMIECLFFSSRQFYQPWNGCSQNQIVQTSIQLTYQRLETDSAPPAVWPQLTNTALCISDMISSFLPIYLYRPAAI